MKVRCIEDNFKNSIDPEFTVGKIYHFDSDTNSFVGDDGYKWYLDRDFCYAGDPQMAKFEIVQELPPLPEVSEYEDEAFEDLEKKLEQQKQLSGILANHHMHVGWTQEETGAPGDSVDCPVAIAYHIHQLQKWLKHIGCDEEFELKISSEYVWVSPFPEVVYEAKEGGVGTLIEYMRHIGGANKCVEKMEDVG